MKSLIVLTLILPLISAIDIHFVKSYGNGIKKIEVPNCREEPCGLIKGQPLEVKITYETTYPFAQSVDDVIDATLSVDIGAYRNRYVYYVLYETSFCKTQPKECPLVSHKEYTFVTNILLHEDIAGEKFMSGFEGGNGKRSLRLNLALEGSKNGQVIGEVYAMFDIQAPH